MSCFGKRKFRCALCAAICTMMAACFAEQDRSTNKVQLLLAELKSGETSVRFNVLRQLRGMGNKARPALPVLFEFLEKERSNFLRVEVSDAIGQIADSREVLHLLMFVHRADIERMRAVMNALGGMGPRAFKAVPLLIALLEKPDQVGREYIAEALGRIGHPMAVPILTENLKDRDLAVASKAARALGAIGIGARVAIPEMIAVAREGLENHALVTRACIDAFAQIGVSDIRALSFLEEASTASNRFVRLAAERARIRLLARE